MIRIHPSSLPFLAGTFGPAVLIGAIGRPLWAVPFLALGSFMLYFFRDPDRRTPPLPGAVYAPADGRILHAGAAQRQAAPAGDWLQISIFLSPLDVHVNRAPVGGRVKKVEYRPGRFFAAFKPEAATENERCEVWISTDDQVVVSRQVVGVLARRIVCQLRPGDQVQPGQRYGIMKFGSRMDVFVPPTAVLKVSVGQSVRAGETVVAVLASGNRPRQDG